MDSGLPQEQVLPLQKIHGKNTITTKKRYSLTSLLFTQFITFINGILLAAVVFSFILHDIPDGLFILAVIMLNGLFGFFQEYRAEKSLEKLKTYAIPHARVFRNGKEEEILSKDIVPGDIVILSEGDRVPADGEIIQTHYLEVDESILTGESLPLAKNVKDTCYLGTLVIKGRGRIKVTAIGMKTRFGQIASTLSTIETDKTPLQKQLDSLGRILSLVIILIAVLLVPLGVSQQKPFLTIILVSISIGIAAIPEGLPAVITIALAIGTSRMARRDAIVRKMPAIETLGSMQVVLVDKTGTLTQNSMRVKKEFLLEKTNRMYMQLGATLGNTASLVQKEGGSFDVIGDKTDGALLLWSKEQCSEKDLFNGEVTDEFVFDVSTKTITTVFEKGGKRFVFVRGAPEMILEKSTLSVKDKENITAHITSYAKEGLRVIGFAYKKEPEKKNKSREEFEQNLIFLGLLGIYDPPRKEVVHAIHEAKHAGIQTIMVTGDNELTAVAIGKEIGLLGESEDVITSDELAKMKDEDLLYILTNTRIFARAKPEDKLRLVTTLQSQGYVVGVTGDGVNDALALKKADVGLAMGESGTDVAKEASDIILLHDNFATLLKAVEEGRTIYQNIVKSILYLLTGNLSELSLVFFAILAGLPTPLLPTQILWINLVTDGLPALALASDRKEKSILSLAPRDPRHPILTRERILFILGVGLSLGGMLMMLFYALLPYVSLAFARTVVFNVLVITHMTIVFFVRKEPFWRGTTFIYFAVLFTLALQFLASSLPVLQQLLSLSLH